MRQWRGISALVLLVVLGVVTPAFAGTAILTWTEAAPDATHAAAATFNIYRSIDPVVCSAAAVLPNPVLSSVAASVLTVTDAATPNVNGTVCYEIEAVNAGGVARSNRASKATTVNPPFAPALTVQ